MQQRTAPSDHNRSTANAARPLRFIVIGKGRSGTNLLVQALNSHPHVRCFGELFNWRRPSIDFGLPGYDGYNAADLRLRESDPLTFLDERIFTGHPDDIRAVGFKLLYQHYLGLKVRPGEIVGAELRVIHVRRRNLLRSLVSQELAEQTGEWLNDPNGAATTIDVTPHKLRYALTHPAWAAAAIRRRIRPQTPRQHAAVPRVHFTAQQVREYVYATNKQAETYDEIFAAHPRVTIWYEDLAHDRDATMRDIWDLLGVPPVPVTTTMRRQNPQPLDELIENYEELRTEFAGTPVARFFEQDDAQ